MILREHKAKRFTQNHFFLQKKGRAGFTMVELAVSVAIFAILTSIMFTSFRDEKIRTALKNTANQFQVDLQAMQNNLQSGVLVTAKLCVGGVNNALLCNVAGDCPTGACVSQTVNSCLGGTDDRQICINSSECNGGTCVPRPPLGYGVTLFRGGLNYQEFADIPNSNPNYQDAQDPIILTRALPSTVSIVRMDYTITSPASSGSEIAGLFIVYSGNNGNATINSIGNTGVVYDTVNVIFKDTKINTCYSIGIQKLGGTVTKRQLASCT